MGARKLTPERASALELERVAYVIGCESSDLSYRQDFGLSYDFAPEWLQRELEQDHGWDSEFCTIVTYGGGYGSEAKEAITDSHGVTWKLIGTYAHGAERECPVPENHPDKVTRAECVLVPDPYRHTKHGHPQTPRAVRAVCPMCEERIGEKHGYIYIGEGFEAVYLKDVPKDLDD